MATRPVERGRSAAAMRGIAVAVAMVLGGCAREPERVPAVLAPESFVDDRFQLAAGEAVEPDRMVNVAGFAYFGTLSGAIPGLREGGDGRTLRLVEDGLPLGPTGSLSAEVVQLGLGRFNHETAKRILFSTSDNSDPRTNGRQYRVEWDEPARIVPRSATRTISIGTTEVAVDVATRRPITSRRLLVENLDTRRALRVWGRPKGGPDLTTGDALIASVVQPGMSAEEKALALWRLIATWRHHDVAAAAWPEASDPVKLLGVYGFGFCNDAAHALAGLLERAGLPARVSAWDQHSVVEVQFDDRWHLLDPDLERVYRTESQQLASVADVFTRRVTTAFSPTGAVPLAEEQFDLIYPRGTERVHHRALPPSSHALRPILEPGDAVVFDFDRGDLLVDRFSYARPHGWPMRFANGTLRRLVSAASEPGCRTARVAWPYPIVGVEISGHGLRQDGPLVVQVRGNASEPWQDVRVERVATEVRANASVWIDRGPLRYGLEARVCNAGSTELDGRAELLLEVTFQFAPRALPSVGYGANPSVWTVEDVTGGKVPGFGGVRITQVWDELDTPNELVAPNDGVVANLDRSFFSRDAGFASTTPLSQQLAAAVGGLDPRSDGLRVALFENGRALGPGDATVESVADKGRGRFALDRGTLRFSASDNTDPRHNDRIYSIVITPGDGASAVPAVAGK